MIDIKPGDMLYFDKSFATAVFIEKVGSKWSYSLRSPTAQNLEFFLVSIHHTEEWKLQEGIEEGRFEFYPAK